MAKIKVRNRGKGIKLDGLNKITNRKKDSQIISYTYCLTVNYPYKMW